MRPLLSSSSFMKSFILECKTVTKAGCALCLYRIPGKCHHDYVVSLNGIYKNCLTFIVESTASSHLKLTSQLRACVSWCYAPQILLSVIHCGLTLSFLSAGPSEALLACLCQFICTLNNSFCCLWVVPGGERLFYLAVLPMEILSVFSNHGLLEPQKLHKLPYLFTHLIDVQNETRIAKKTYSFFFFKPLLETIKYTLKKPFSAFEEWIL